MHILDTYISRKFLSVLSFALIAFIIIYVIVDLIENLDQFMGHDVPKVMVLLYYMYSLPYIIILVLPVACLLASLYSVGQMARNNEIVAISSSGIPLTRILLPLFIIALIISIFAIFFGEKIVPLASVKRSEINDSYIETYNNRNRSILRNIHIRDDFNRYISIKTLNLGKKEAQRISIQEVDDVTLKSRIDAEDMVFRNGVWVLHNGVQRNFSVGQNNQELETAIPFDSLKMPDLKLDTERLLVMKKQPEEMSYKDLKTFISEVVRNGGDPNRWLVDLYLKLSFPFSNFIIVLFGAPLSAKKQRSGAGLGFAISLVVCFVYFGIVKTTQSLGQNGTLPPLFAAWLANVFFAVLGFWVLLRARQ